MTVLPPGLIAPPDATPVVVPVDRPVSAAPVAPRWNRWSIAFVALVALTVLALVLAVADLLHV